MGKGGGFPRRVRILLHSPCRIDAETKREIEALGEVGYIVAPGSYHYFHVESAQIAFPAARTYICPGVERKRPKLGFEWILGEKPPPVWAEELSQTLVRGTRYIWEVAFCHEPTITLILVDLVENITDSSKGTDWVTRFWLKAVFRMWNRPLPAPEYRLGWVDREAVRRSLERILSWDFERVMMAHGDPIESGGKEAVRRAWAGVLEGR